MKFIHTINVLKKTNIKGHKDHKGQRGLKGRKERKDLAGCGNGRRMSEGIRLVALFTLTRSQGN